MGTFRGCILNRGGDIMKLSTKGQLRRLKRLTRIPSDVSDVDKTYAVPAYMSILYYRYGDKKCRNVVRKAAKALAKIYGNTEEDKKRFSEDFRNFVKRVQS
jgi:hypothetical protein